MNPRIKELVKEHYCRTEYENGTVHECYEFNPEELEKLAELIVQECMTTILKESKWYWDKDEFESSNAIQNAGRRVKEHFGVK